MSFGSNPCKIAGEKHWQGLVQVEVAVGHTARPAIDADLAR